MCLLKSSDLHQALSDTQLSALHSRLALASRGLASVHSVIADPISHKCIAILNVCARLRSQYAYCTMTTASNAPLSIHFHTFEDWNPKLNLSWVYHQTDRFYWVTALSTGQSSGVYVHNRRTKPKAVKPPSAEGLNLASGETHSVGPLHSGYLWALRCLTIQQYVGWFYAFNYAALDSPPSGLIPALRQLGGAMLY
jgi:hypothetical protein